MNIHVCLIQFYASNIEHALVKYIQHGRLPKDRGISCNLSIGKMMKQYQNSENKMEHELNMNKILQWAQQQMDEKLSIYETINYTFRL
jgi:hypothetical protein